MDQKFIGPSLEFKVLKLDNSMLLSERQTICCRLRCGGANLFRPINTIFRQSTAIIITRTSNHTLHCRLPINASLVIMSTNFQVKKSKILEQIQVPDEEYTDLSPKGSIDVGIRVLVGEINKIDGLVTTSSCAGRISVFLEGTKKASLQPLLEDSVGQSAQEPAIAGPGGKGGGKWLFVDHEPVSKTSTTIHALFGIDIPSGSPIEPGARFVHFKFEAMVRRMPFFDTKLGQLTRYRFCIF